MLWLLSSQCRLYVHRAVVWSRTEKVPAFNTYYTLRPIYVSYDKIMKRTIVSVSTQNDSLSKNCILENHIVSAVRYVACGYSETCTKWMRIRWFCLYTNYTDFTIYKINNHWKTILNQSKPLSEEKWAFGNDGDEDCQLNWV